MPSPKSQPGGVILWCREMLLHRTRSLHLHTPRIEDSHGKQWQELQGQEIREWLTDQTETGASSPA